MIIAIDPPIGQHNGQPETCAILAMRREEGGREAIVIANDFSMADTGTAWTRAVAKAAFDMQAERIVCRGSPNNSFVRAMLSRTGAPSPRFWQPQKSEFRNEYRQRAVCMFENGRLQGLQLFPQLQEDFIAMRDGEPAWGARDRIQALLIGIADLLDPPPEPPRAGFI